MRLSGISMYSMALFLCGVQACWGADYLYSPHPPATGEDGAEGVLVREITVKRGDTLSKLSRRWAGRDYYYPQILLFNEIKNPHWIQIGDVLRVPVSHKSLSRQSHKKSSRRRSQRHHVASAAAPQSMPITSSATTAVQPLSDGEQNSFNRAMSSLQKGDCTAAIKLIDEFIVRYPASPLLPEATLNRAECYLKLSAK